MYRIGIDVGGTFTDLVAIDESGSNVVVSKAPSTANPIFGILNAIKKANIPTSSVSEIVHGTTVATNALLQRKGPKIAYVTTKGFRDIPYIQRTHRKFHYDLHWDKPEPLVERQNCFEVSERIDYKGNVITKFNEKEALRVISECKRRGIQAISVNFLFSYVNPAHELRMYRLIRKHHPEAKVSLSHQVDPEWREYERASTTICDAFLKPLITQYSKDLWNGLKTNKVSGNLLFVKSNGGMMDHVSAREKPVNLIMSGPAGGVLGAVYFSKIVGLENVITTDMGGTSFDVSLLPNLTYRYITTYEVEWNLPVRAPMIDVGSIGAGGGSIAWLDKGGLLRVGPKSAGAEPGPACYGRGGKDACVTDANLVLGRLNPKYFLGGDMKIYPDLGKEAVKRLADKLSMDLHEAAEAVINIVNHNMANAIDLVSLDKGYDPREFALISYGGAGSLHATSLCKATGIKEIVVPTFVGAFSAFGALVADMRIDLIHTVTMRSDKLDINMVNERLKAMRKKGTEEIAKDGYKDVPSVMQYIEMRYLGQNYGLDILVPAKETLTEDDVKETFGHFHQAHKEQYGYSIDDEVIEFVNFKATVIGATVKPVLKKIGEGSGSVAPKEKRDVYFGSDGGIRPTPIYHREALPAGYSLQGPAVIEEKFSTVLIEPTDTMRVDEYGNLRIAVGGGTR